MKARIPSIKQDKDLTGSQANAYKENIFIDKICGKSQKGLFKRIAHKSSVKSFIKKIHKGSPGFDMLWQMADFIRISELVFCYDNSLSNTNIGLYSSKNYNQGTNGFKIIDVGFNCIITIKLFAKSRQVALEIERTNGENMRTSINFIDEKWEHNPSIYDEMLLEQVIKSINKRIIMLFDYCYELR